VLVGTRKVTATLPYTQAGLLEEPAAQKKKKAPVCEACEENDATKQCSKCGDLYYCDACDLEMYSTKKSRKHERRAL
jgi:hypothetical protein